MKITDTNHTHYFLSGGGEMSELTRSFDWSQTSLGTPDTWPHSLKTTLGIVLHSAFPMFLFWGEDLICFYNDAFRPSLGTEGKHPAIGKKATEVWAEIWETLQPAVTSVMQTGQPVLYEDKLIPYYRNGQIEDIYWTYSSSPAYGNDGNINGVLVTCVETTEKVFNQKRLAESELKFRMLIEEMPLAACVLKGKDLIVDMVNEMGIQTWGKGPNVLGKPLAEVLPELKDQAYLDILSDVLTTGIPYIGESAPFTLTVNGIPKLYIKNVIYKPLKDSSGITHSVLCINMDVSDRAEAQQELENNLKQLVSYFEQASVAIATISKENLTFRLVNSFYAELVGRKPEELENKPLLEALPELKGQGFDVLLNTVIETGIAYSASEVSVELLRNNTLETIYVNLTYQPQIGLEGVVAGILVVATDVTQQVTSRNRVEASELKLRKVIEESPVATILFRGKDLVIDVANDFVIEMYGQGPGIIGKPLAEVLKNGDEYIKLLLNTFETGLPFEGKEGVYNTVINGVARTYIMDFIYKPLKDADGNVESILAIAIDVSEKVKMYDALEKSQQQLLTYFEKSPVGIAVLDKENFTFTLANDFYAEFIGRKREEIEGKPLLEVIPELEAQGFVLLLENVLKTGIPYNASEARVELFRNGRCEIVYVNLTYQPKYNDLKEITGILVVISDVTQQVSARKKVEESEGKLRTIVANAPAAIAMFIGRDLIIENPNQTFIDVAGKGPDIIGKPLAEAVPELKDQPFLQMLDEVFTSGKTVQTYGSFIKIIQNGIPVEKYYDFTYTPIFDSEGNVYAILDIAIDVTEQMLDRQKLEKSEQEIRSLIESSPFPIAVYIGREMRIQFANQNILDVWGKGNDVIGKLYSVVLPELENQQIFKQLDDVYTTGIAFHAKNQRVDLVVDNTLQSFYFNYSFTPLYDAAGNVYGVMNTAAEVTALNLAKQRIEQSEQNLRNMILQAPVAMCILTGPDHIIEIANDFMIELWGKPKEDVINRPVFDALPDARGQGLETVMRDVYENGITFKADEMPVNLLRNGKHEIIYQNFVYEPYKEECGKIIGVLAVTVDVTAQVLGRLKIEEIVSARTKELATANDNLQKSNSELAQFAYIASHDLQEPLRKISMFTQLLESRIGDDLDEQSKKHLNKISGSAIRMNTLIKDVLSYSELIKETEEFIPVDLNLIIENTLVDFELLIEQKNVSIQFQHLPVIEAIPLQMAQLFGNLISNALKFSRTDKQPIITITSSLLTKEEKEKAELNLTIEYYRISVIDNGIGLKPEHTEQIFNIFQRLHRKSEYEGTGIGLAMCKKIALNHNGSLDANGSSENGAVFNIILPKSHS